MEEKCKQLEKLYNKTVVPNISLAVRVLFGLLWLDGASWKEPTQFGLQNKDNLWYWVNKAVEHPVFAPYTWLVQHVIQPHFLIFGWITFISELALAFSFILGFKVKFFAIIALAQSVAIGLSVANAPGEWYWSYIMMAMVSIVFLALPTHKLSLDYLFRKKQSSKKK